MTTKIELFNVNREDLTITEKVVNDFLRDKAHVTKVFLSPGYYASEATSYNPIILVVYQDT